MCFTQGWPPRLSDSICIITLECEHISSSVSIHYSFEVDRFVRSFDLVADPSFRRFQYHFWCFAGVCFGLCAGCARSKNKGASWTHSCSMCLRKCKRLVIFVVMYFLLIDYDPCCTGWPGNSSPLVSSLWSKVAIRIAVFEPTIRTVAVPQYPACRLFLIPAIHPWQLRVPSFRPRKWVFALIPPSQRT